MSREKRSTETPNLDKVLAEIENLKRGMELLDTIYLEYTFEQTIKEETWHKLQNFMGFDDSE